MAVMENDAMPLLICTLNFSSTARLTASPGSLRMMSKNSRAGMMHSPGSLISAGTDTVMPVSRLYPESTNLTPART